jgi:hypothetical protein
VGAELPGLVGRADWTVLSDCRSEAEVVAHQHVAGNTVLALPIRRLTYRLHKGSLQLLTNVQNANLIDNVRAFEVNLVEVEEGERGYSPDAVRPPAPARAPSPVERGAAQPEAGVMKRQQGVVLLLALGLSLLLGLLAAQGLRDALVQQRLLE